jgi:aryl-alcohol dehydrogenase-like predicted oxidoreductase
MNISLGTVQFGIKYGIANLNGQVSITDAHQIINYAKSKFIDTLDTAISYGESEQILGKIGVLDFKVITKLPKIPNYLEDPKSWVIDQIQLSLQKLNCDSLYAVLLHRSEDLLTDHGYQIFNTLNDLKYKKLIQKNRNFHLFTN